MSDLHAQLLRWFEPGADRGDLEDAIAHGEAALLAAIKVHAPVQHQHYGVLCGECSYLESGQGFDDVLRFVAEPCNTLRAIAEQLGIEP